VTLWMPQKAGLSANLFKYRLGAKHRELRETYKWFIFRDIVSCVDFWQSAVPHISGNFGDQPV
jgi:hypothetical protein